MSSAVDYASYGNDFGLSNNAGGYNHGRLATILVKHRWLHITWHGEAVRRPTIATCMTSESIMSNTWKQEYLVFIYNIMRNDERLRQASRSAYFYSNFVQESYQAREGNPETLVRRLHEADGTLKILPRQSSTG